MKSIEYFLVADIKRNLPTEKAKSFEAEVASMLKTCENPEVVVNRFTYWVIGGDWTDGLINTPKLLKATAEVRELYRRKIAGETVTPEEWEKARENADRAVDAVAAAEGKAANAAYWSAWAAAEGKAAEGALKVAYWAAWAAAEGKAEAEGAAYWASMAQAYERMAAKLIELLQTNT